MTYAALFAAAPDNAEWRAGILRGAAAVRQSAGHMEEYRRLAIQADAEVEEALADRRIDRASVYAC